MAELDAGLPIPPRRPTPAADRNAQPRRAARRRSLTKKAIVDAALKVLDSEGLDAMTMRRVAQELDTGAASLYAHVADKEELIQLVVERVVADMNAPGPPDPQRWQEQLIEAGRAMRAALSAHGDIARATFARIPLGPNALRTMDAIVALLRAGGLHDQVVAYAADILPLYVTAVAYEESLYSQQDVTPEQLTKYVADMREYFAALPADQFPNMKALAIPLTSGAEGDERFEFGLRVIVRGLEAMSEEYYAAADAPDTTRS
jgi:AcrR family transcriptional regulator